MACWQAGGRIVIHQLEADWLRYPLDFRIYLPPCYDEQPERTFPVLYLFHGQSFTDDQWERIGAGETAGRLIAKGEMVPFLIVMPRDREWTPSDEDPLGRAFIELLLPWVDEHYRTLAERSGRAVGGLSRGAGWAVHFGLRNWQDFSAIGAHSPALFWNDGPATVKFLDSIPIEEMPRVWIDLGARDEKEILESANWFETQLAMRNIPHEWHLFSGYHDEKYWRSHIEQYLRWYAEDW
jgi:enterochelin esterase-like enzyme